jgi:hypothetical protein
VFVLGTVGTTHLGTAQVTADSNTYPTGVQATGQTGTVSFNNKANVYPIGVQGATQIGTVIPQGKATVSVTGVVGIGVVNPNPVLVWSDIDDSQTTDWVDVIAPPITVIEVIDCFGGATLSEVTINGVYDIRFRRKPVNGWTPVDDTQTTTWTKIAA